MCLTAQAIRPPLAQAPYNDSHTHSGNALRMTLLLITLPLGNSPDTARFDYVLSDDGRAVRSHARCSAAQLPKADAATQEIVAVVPAAALSWHHVQLPAGTLPKRLRKEAHSPRVRAILEGLLEDQLLDEPAKLHFALQPDASPEGPVWVAVCERQWLRNTLGVLQQAGCTPQRVVPEWAPATPPSTTSPVRTHKPVLWVIGTPEAARLVWADASGVHVLPTSLAQGIPKSNTQVGPPGAKLLAEPAVAKLAETLLHQEANMVTPAKRLLRCASSRWNLAQGELARRNPFLQQAALLAEKLWSAPHWQPARWAVLAIALVHLIGINTWAWHANSQLAQKRTAIRDTLLATFPQTTAVVDAGLQMQRGVSGLGQSSGASTAQDMEMMLSALGAAPSMARVNTVPTAIEFTPGELRFKGLILPPDLGGDLERELQATGFESRMDGDTLVVKVRSAL